MESKTRSKIVRFGALALLVTAFVPVPQIVAPDWKVTTLDASHRPIRGVTVREVWQQYSLQASSHEEDRTTDNKGEVFFARRTHWSTFIGRVAGCIRQIWQTGINASCGPHSYLVSFGEGIDTLDWQNPGEEDGTTLPWQSSTLILNR